MKPARNCIKAERILKHTLERLGALTDGIEEIIYVVDPRSHEILFVNKKTEENFGARIVGRKCYDAFQGRTTPCPFCKNSSLFGSNVGKTRTREIRNERNKRWYRCMDRAIEWPARGHVRFGIAINITQQKRIEEALRDSEQKFRAISTCAKDAIILANNNGSVIYWNPAARKMFGYEKSRMTGLEVHKSVVPKRLQTLHMAEFKRLRDTGESAPTERSIETRAVKEDGTEFPIELSVSAFKLKGKWHALSIIRDTTERKKMEESLKQSEEIFRSVVENSHNAILILDDNYQIVYANSQAEQQCGYNKMEITGRDFREFLQGENREIAQDRYLRRQRGESVPSQYEFQNIWKNGEKRIVEVKSTTAHWACGKTFTVVSLIDVTERKKMEVDHERFQARLSALNQYGQSLDITKNLEDIYRVTLDAMEKTLGFEVASILIVEGRNLTLKDYRGYNKKLSLNLPLQGEKGLTVRAAKTAKPVLVRDVSKEKAYIPGGKGMLSELAVPIKTGRKVLGVLNVESKKLAAFNEEDQKLLEILASHAAIAISNLTRRDEVEKFSCKLEYLMKSSTQIMHVEDMRRRLKVIAKAIRRFGWERAVISLRDESLEGIDLVTSGLTREERKLLLKRKAPGSVWHERLGPKFEKFRIGEFYYLPWMDPWIRTNVHHVPPGTSISDATTYTGVPSKLAVEEMVDWHPQDMLYAPLRTPEGKIVGILSMDDPLDGRKPTRESLAPLELFLHQAAMTIENAQLIGSLRDARQQLETHNEQLELKVDERTRELRESQEQLLKAQKLAVIGELAGMVGHDLRNPLTSISGAQYYLKRRLSLGSDGKIKEMLNLIEKNITYSNKIINDLLDYSREVELELTQVSPESMVREALSLVEIPRKVKLVDCSRNKPKMRVDPEKIKRCFVNIIKNAVESMPKGGTLRITCKRVDDNARFEFSDTGGGMSRQTMQKLWTPLFTTKAKGMGFGLPVCKRFVEGHGGYISAESKPGKGTTFTVILPIEPKTEKGGERVWVRPLESSLLTTMKT